MVYIVKKNIHGKDYYYLKSSFREKGKVKTKTIKYLGKTKKEAEEKFKKLKQQGKDIELKEKKESPIQIQKATYDDIMNLASRRSFFFPTSEIYKGPGGFWDFGPYGTSIRRKIIQLWRKELVQKEDMLEIFGSQTMPEEVFKASGHLTRFNDPLTQCPKCKAVFRADELITEKTGNRFPEATPIEKLEEEIRKNNIKCSKCGSSLEKVIPFNMMVNANIGVMGKYSCYLRPETCQNIFLDFIRMVKTMRVTLPKGIAQAGKVFRNEISPRTSLFRTIEFSQMEAEIFFNPEKINEIENFDEIKKYKIRILRLNKKDIEELSAEELIKNKIVSGKLISYYLARTQQLYEKYGIGRENLRFKEVGKDERAFYAKETWDFEVKTSLGWIEVIANNYRTDFDLKAHSQGSKQDLSMIEDSKKFTPHIWEISIGLDRTLYAIIDNAYKKEPERVVLTVNPKLAPYDAAIFPLVNKGSLQEIAKKIFKELKQNFGFEIFYDESGSIGRRYRRQDEIGTLICITIDFQTKKDKTVTIRDRDTMKQKRVKISKLPDELKKVL